MWSRLSSPSPPPPATVQLHIKGTCPCNPNIPCSTSPCRQSWPYVAEGPPKHLPWPGVDLHQLCCLTEGPGCPLTSVEQPAGLSNLKEKVQLPEPFGLSGDDPISKGLHVPTFHHLNGEDSQDGSFF